MPSSRDENAIETLLMTAQIKTDFMYHPVPSTTSRENGDCRLIQGARRNNFKDAVVIRELAHADDRVLPGKVRGELIKVYYQNGMNAAEALRVYHRNHRQRRGPGTLQALRDLVRKFEDTGCTCNKPRSGRPTVSEDVVMEVHHTQ
ncbi:hypothetical protein TNCV_1756491 [Trichonephila clavipes]|nr:hypothetical protein TNCV_1756491 [Trichonephila clavipes]